MRRLAATMAALAVLHAGAAARADGDVHYGAFKTAFVDQVGKKLDAELEQLQAQIDAASPEARPHLLRAQAELKLLKKRVEDVNTVDALWSSLGNGRDALKAIGEEAARDYGGSVHVGVISAQEASRVARASQYAAKGADYLAKVNALAKDLDEVSTTDLSPGTKGLAQSFLVLSSLLSTFGDKAPLVGSFLQAYGDLGAELMKTTIALDKKIAEREQGQLMPGVHGVERGYMLDRLAAHGMSSAQRITGLRDAYRADGGKLVIWDRAARDWAVASDWEPGLSEEELVKRYLFFTKRGVTDPTPEQVVRGYRRMIALELEPSASHIPPGGEVELTVHGKLVVDGASVDGMKLYAKVTLREHSGMGDGDFQGSTTVKLGESVRWKAPNNLNESYVFEVELDADTAKAASSAGPATATVRTGTETRLTLEADAREAVADQEVHLTARLLTPDGEPISGKAAGSIEMTVSPEAGGFTDQEDLGDPKGARWTWLAPKRPGRYTITARYAGATSYALFGDHTAGAENQVTIDVAGPEADAGPADAGPDAAPEAPDAGAADAAVADAGAADVDWPGRWRGTMKSTTTTTGIKPFVSSDTVELVVTRAANGNIVLKAAKHPAIELTPTPSNPHAARGEQDLPRPKTPGLKGWKGHAKWTAFLSGGKLHLAVSVSIEMVIQSADSVETHRHTNDSIGVLEKVR